MTPERYKKLLIVLVAAMCTAGQIPVQASQEGAQRQDPDEAEQFSLRQEERIGDQGRDIRAGDTRFIFNEIFEFTDAANDLFLWGWLPTMSGNIADNAFMGGQKVDVGPEGRIGGDAFIFAQTGIVSGAIEGDLYAFVADLTIAETGSVGGAIHGSSGALTIKGHIGGPIIYVAGAVIIDGPIAGDVRIEAGELELGPNAVIEGDLRYESPRQATIDPAAQVAGETQHVVPQDDEDDPFASAVEEAQGWFSLWSFAWGIWWFLASFLAGALFLAVGGEAARKPAALLASEPALGLGFGFVVAVVLPAAAILAMILLVTIPLGVISLTVYLIAVYFARLVAAQTVGDWLLRTARVGTEPSAYASLALGLVLFYFLTQIPYVGFLIWLAAIVAGLGGIYLAVRRYDPGAGTAPGVPEPPAQMAAMS